MTDGRGPLRPRSRHEHHQWHRSRERHRHRLAHRAAALHRFAGEDPDLPADRILNASKTALLDVNARVLSLGNASRAFRLDEVFQSVLTSSSNEDVLGATATTKANPGQYAFRVKQLVSNSQKMTGGFVSSDESPLGLDQLSFEWGNGRLVGDVSLADLNGGTGIDRGSIRIKDQAGNESVIDLSEATTLQEVVDAINDDAGVQVVASFDTDRMKIVDESGGIGAARDLQRGRQHDGDGSRDPRNRDR